MLMPDDSDWTVSPLLDSFKVFKYFYRATADYGEPHLKKKKWFCRNTSFLFSNFYTSCHWRVSWLITFSHHSCIQTGSSFRRIHDNSQQGVNASTNLICSRSVMDFMTNDVTKLTPNLSDMIWLHLCDILATDGVRNLGLWPTKYFQKIQQPWSLTFHGPRPGLNEGRGPRSGH